MSAPSTRLTSRPQSSGPSLGVLTVCAAALVPVVMILATYEMRAVYIMAGLTVVVVAARLLRSDVALAVRDVRARRAARAAADPPVVTGPAGATALPRSAGRPGRLGSVVLMLFVAAMGAGVAWVAAMMGTKGLAATVGAVAVVSLLIFVRDRTLFFTFATVCSLVFVMHKSIGPQDLQQSGGAISVYVTTFDLMLVLLYGLWVAEGTFVADVKAALRRPLLWVPLVGVLALLPSLLVAPSLIHSAAELTRMGWMFLLYAYVAIRVRTRTQIWTVLAALGLIGAVELVVVVLQWRTGGVLGLSFLGVPTTLGERTTDSTVIGRPFGTMIHPVFMAAALGMIAMVALAFAIELERRLIKIAALGVSGACLACMWISQTRASFVAAGLAGAFIVLVGLVRGRLRWQTLAWYGVAGLVLAAAFTEKILAKIEANFGTGHYDEEVASRLEMNDIALRIIDDHWILGVGLNNFEVILARYEANPVIFYGHPVHNLYLLYLSEVGIVGFLGVVLVGLALYDAALRLARSRDRLLGGVGIGVAGAIGFVMVEELLGFSLRQDIPLALFWLLAGLVAAATTMAGEPWPGSFRRPLRKPVPARPPRSVSPSTRQRQHSLVRVAGASLAIALIATVLPGPVATVTTPPAAAAASAKPLLIWGKDKDNNNRGAIYTANVDGSGLTQVTPKDDRHYDWPRWAFGNTKIVYTVQPKQSGTPASIYLMNPDGSDPQLLAHFEHRVAQPLIDPTGRYLIYNGMNPSFPRVALYRMDLRTRETVNMTQATTLYGSDADPTVTSQGDRVIFVWNKAGRGAVIGEFDFNGSSRRELTPRGWFDTDPDVNTAGDKIVVASYRGPDDPSTDGGRVRSEFFQIVAHPRDADGPETVLTTGSECLDNQPNDPCAVAEMSGYVPRFTPDDRSVSFVGPTDVGHTCVCAVNLDGSDPRVLVRSNRIAIGWHDWAQPAGYSTTVPPITPPTPAEGRIVFSATSRTTGQFGIYTADGDGSDVKQITPADGRFYSWPRWAFGNTKIVYTVRTGILGTGEEVRIMNPDGSGSQLIKAFPFRVGQPLIDPTGRYLHYTGQPPWFPMVAQFRMDLRTLQSVNISARHDPTGAFDADPFFSPDGKQLYFVYNQKVRGARIMRMDTDGRNRRTVIDGTYYNTDPAVSANNAWLATASYRGPGAPTSIGGDSQFNNARTDHFKIVVKPVGGGKETVLTQGKNCAIRVGDPCSIPEMSGYLPRFLPDSTAVAFSGALDGRRTCICVMDVDGSNPRAILVRSDIALNWFTWTQPEGLPTSTVHIGTAVPKTKVLLTMTGVDAPGALVIASPDLIDRLPVPLPDGLQATSAQWLPDGKSILFTARTPKLGPARSPHPAPPDGKQRREHVTLADFDPLAAHMRAAAIPSVGHDAAREQVFLRAADGKVSQLTDPWIEDWQDGLREGDARSNTRPRLSPDGRYLVVTNTSTSTGESFLLRFDLQTKAVVNLTNATAGAVPTDDSDAAFAPDGKRMVFSWTEGDRQGIYAMQPGDGERVAEVTTEAADGSMPTFTPNGSALVWVRERGDTSSLVTSGLDGRGRATAPRVLSGSYDNVRAPVVSADSTKVAFLGKVGNTTGVLSAGLKQGSAEPVQPDAIHFMTSVDWTEVQ